MMVRNLIIRGMALAEDQAFLRGTGVGPGPRGLRYSQGITSNTANATVNVTNIETDARTAELGLMNNDIPMIAPCWLMAPRTLAYLRDLRDGNGNLYYPSLQGPNPTWRGYPVENTNSIPINLGGTTNESEVTLVDFAYAMIADSYQVRIDASDTASYKVNGTLVSAFSQNQTVIRALTGHDFFVTRPKAVSLITAVKWF
jgi:HK97 family phage major capsid protein